MALEAPELPIIDFSEEAMKPGTTTWDLTCKHVRKALEEYGWFEATFSDINNELNPALFSSLEKLFDLPKDTKRRATSGQPSDGYTCDIPRIPLYEAMGVTDPVNFQSVQNFVLCMWPQGDTSACEILHSFATRLHEVEKAVRRMIFQSYGVEKHFEEESKSARVSLRLSKYGAPMTDEGTRGLGAHFDKGTLSILHANGPGLQVRTKDGEWINITPSRSSLIVMIGESFHGWSNGRLKCPLHRVTMSGSKSRYSVGLFSGKDGTVEIPKELVDEKHPLLFKPFDLDGILQAFQQQRMDKAYTPDNDNIVPTVASCFAI